MGTQHANEVDYNVGSVGKFGKRHTDFARGTLHGTHDAIYPNSLELCGFASDALKYQRACQNSSVNEAKREKVFMPVARRRR
jgi:hypothetical protein